MLRFATLLKISCCTSNIVITIDTIKELGKDVLLSCHEHGTDKKISEFPWGIKPQTFGFCIVMLYHWAAENLRRARPISKFKYDLFLFHYWAQNLPFPYSIYKTIEKLSTECCKNRTKVMAKSTKRNFARRQWELKVKTCKQHNAWENKITQVAVRSYFCISLLKNFLCFVLSSYILTL